MQEAERTGIASHGLLFIHMQKTKLNHSSAIFGVEGVFRRNASSCVSFVVSVVVIPYIISVRKSNNCAVVLASVLVKSSQKDNQRFCSCKYLSNMENKVPQSIVYIAFLFCMVSSCECSDTVTNEVVDSPSTSDKKSRLISFNNDHGEVKIELDFAVPFMNIPVNPKKLGGGHGLEPLLEVNTKGLVTVGTILIILVTIVPKVVKLFIPQAHATVTDGLMPLMSRIDEALHTMNIPSMECYQRSACWVASNSVINPSYLNNFSPDWLKNTLDSPEIQEALRKGQNGEDCSQYKCSVPLQTMSKLVNIGKTMLS